MEFSFSFYSKDVLLRLYREVYRVLEFSRKVGGEYQYIRDKGDSWMPTLWAHNLEYSGKYGRYYTFEMCDINDGDVVYFLNRPRIGGAGAEWNPEEAVMSVGAGGRIKQSILEDMTEVTFWDSRAPTLLNISILNAALFEQIVGLLAPPSPISFQTYRRYRIPFYEVANEPGSSVAGNFEKVASVKPLEESAYLPNDDASVEQSQGNCETPSCQRASKV